ncbi:hypothetical protein PTSG_06496 [Salpingoeca rosetta]|uniref:Pseudouridine synthase I TruA alpha/beta domain-containing protein n=1 Tax=Salpingoeca rosetta (strain ATCC 50818 / BSB-021) TaxID=946362 RepID=F2UFZ2_SALR5|nr:uncharacterized protein PTSG_06496 [Salpingoeca rosetta]EGD75420.1 hypothetical protein PTSG_06496 [Salpingoeca rosetta]|eukprot:XP_004991877.1 hypothetical protein PTSG_06496 [Salpingoeca rosetta]
MSSRKLLESVSREALIKRCLDLEQALLRNKLTLPPIANVARKSGKKSKPQKPFDFSRYSKRKIALKVAYLGEKYHGLAIQISAPDTIEAHLFEALEKSKLVEDIKTADYSRCGRTDKGVSAYCQVVSLVVRSNLNECRGFISKPSVEPAKKKAKATVDELDYTKILNGLLPPEIRVVDWGAVDTDFSARFSCNARHYKYFFHRANMDTAAMQAACDHLVGEHDFRNFCKADVAGGVTNFVRTIKEARVCPAEIGDASVHSSDGDFDLWEFNIIGHAFLWHQVRCMMAVLFMVGRGDEQPGMVRHLLNIDECTHKPQYVMASELPLVLYDCKFDGIDWSGNDEQHAARIHTHWRSLWQTNSIRNALLRCFMTAFGHTGVRQYEGKAFSECADEVQWPADPKHRPLMQRQREESIAERMAKVEAKKQKEEEEQGTAADAADDDDGDDDGDGDGDHGAADKTA